MQVDDAQLKEVYEELGLNYEDQVAAQEKGEALTEESASEEQNLEDHSLDSEHSHEHDDEVNTEPNKPTS